MNTLVFTSLYPNNIWRHHGVFVKERMTHVAKLGRGRVQVVAPVPYFPPIKLNARWPFSQVRSQEIIEELEVHHPRYFMIPKASMAVHGLMMFLCALPTMRKIYKNFAFDIIDAHYVYPDGFAAVLLGSVFKKPVVVSARGSDINLFTSFPLIRKLIRHTLRRADGVIAVCQALKEAMIQIEIAAEKIAVIPNGVDSDKFYPVPKQLARKRLALTGEKIMLSVGALIPRKGFDLLIRALKILLEEYQMENLHLVIIGEGPSRRELESLISSLKLSAHVRLVGSIAHQDLYLWYSAADIFCLASSREGWPNVLLESIACGTPVVATNIWGIPEVIRSDSIGLLTQRSERQISAGVALALRKAWDAVGLRQYAEEHSWDRTALSVCRVFESVLQDRRAVR